jgi:hypothetical protein
MDLLECPVVLTSRADDQDSDRQEGSAQVDLDWRAVDPDQTQGSRSTRGGTSSSRRRCPGRAPATRGRPFRGRRQRGVVHGIPPRVLLDPPSETPPQEPQHKRGIVGSEPGLYFIGLKFLYSVSSEQIHGVERDADYISGGSLPGAACVARNDRQTINRKSEKHDGSRNWTTRYSRDRRRSVAPPPIARTGPRPEPTVQLAVSGRG